MAPFAAARVEQEIVKIPKHQVLVALGKPRTAGASGIDLEQNLAIEQQSEQLKPEKRLLPAQLLDRLRRGERGERGCNPCIADLEQRASARGFQHHVVAAPAHIGKARQHENVGIAERRGARPIVGNLRFDHDLRRAVARTAEAILQ